MSRRNKCFFTFIILLLCLGCAKKTPIPVDYSYSKDAVIFQIQTDEKLNLYQGVPHTLLVCVYQLKNLTEYNQLLAEKNGLYQLMRGERFSPSVTFTDKVILHPGTKRYLVFDRAEGTKYVAVVAGYYNMATEKMTRVFDIPVVEEKKSFKKTKVVKPLDVRIYFGPQQID